jgi:hypothetical protein
MEEQNMVLLASIATSPYFRQIRPGENFTTIAERYGVNEQEMIKNNPDVKGEVGEIVVISQNN